MTFGVREWIGVREWKYKVEEAGDDGGKAGTLLGEVRGKRGQNRALGT